MERTAIKRQAVVLAVDDEPNNLLILKYPLAKEGFTLLTAESGEKAFEILEDNRVDVILLDWMMPRMSGIDVLAILKENDKLRMIPVIMLTAKNSADEVKTALLAGANDYLTKPFDRVELIARVKAAARERTLSAALESSNASLKETNQQLTKSNKFIRETFGRYMSDEVVEMVLESGDTLDLEGKIRDVTVMMTDIRGFATMASNYPPEKVLEMLNGYFDVMTEIIASHMGVIIDFVGDAMMILFGAPIIRDDDALRSIACAIEMQSAMNRVNSDNARKGLPPIEMGIGLNSGEVIAGNVGSFKRAKYGAVGNHVNLTSRIEACTVGAQILASEDTLKSAGDDVTTGKKIEVSLKGISKPVTLHEVIGLKGNYNIRIPELKLDIHPLKQQCHLTCETLINKVASGTLIDGEILKLSSKNALISFTENLLPLSDLQFKLAGDPPVPDDYFHGKMVDESKDKNLTYLIHFTSVPDEVADYFKSLV